MAETEIYLRKEYSIRRYRLALNLVVWETEAVVMFQSVICVSSIIAKVSELVNCEYSMGC
jgi:hypothetical protein